MPIRIPSAWSSTQRLGTGHVESPVVNRVMSWPAARSPRAIWSTTSSIPPYKGGGIGVHGGAMSAIRMDRFNHFDARVPCICPVPEGDSDEEWVHLNRGAAPGETTGASR